MRFLELQRQALEFLPGELDHMHWPLTEIHLLDVRAQVEDHGSVLRVRGQSPWFLGGLGVDHHRVWQPLPIQATET
jgi:hypothetical protein